MQNINVTIMNIRTQKHQLIKSKASALHSVGNRKEVTNAIDALSDKNEIIVLGQRMSGSDEALKVVENYMDNLKPVTTYNADDVLNRTNQKKKIRRWLKGAKTTEQEKAVYQEVMNRLENNQTLDNDVIDEFIKITVPIARHNDKLKAIKSLVKSDMKIKASGEMQGKAMEIITVEKCFKITEATDFNMDAVEQRKMMEEFHNAHFPAYPVIYTAAHYDERKDHCHLMHSGKNADTGLFDYPDAEAQVVQKHMKSLNMDSTAYGKKWVDYSEVELKEHGEIWQNMNYEHANKKLAELGIDDWQFKKLEGQAKIDAHNRIANDPTSKKAMTNRAYNNAHFNEIKSERLKNEISELLGDKTIMINDIIGLQNEAMKEEKKTRISKAKNIELENINKGLKSQLIRWFKDGLNYINKSLTGDKAILEANKTLDSEPANMEIDTTEIDVVYDELVRLSGNDEIEKIRKKRKSKIGNP